MENSIYKTNEKNKSADGFLGLMLLFYVIWRTPFVGYYTNTYFAMLVLGCFCGLLLFLKNRWTIQSISFLFLAGIVSVIEFSADLIDGNNVIMLVWELFLSLLPIIAGCMIVTNKMIVTARKFITGTIIAYIITAITTFIGVTRFPGASRLLATDLQVYTKFYPLNIGGFDFIYSLVLLHPLAVYLFRKFKKMYYAIPFSIITIVCVVASEYTMAVLLYSISLIAYFLPLNMNPIAAKHRIRKIVVIGLVLAVFLPVIFGFISKFEILGSIGEKLFDISNLLQGEVVQEESGVAIRQNIYLKSWNTFLKRPITGSKVYGSPTVGGHSYILDTLGDWGIIGFIIALSLFDKVKKFYRKSFKNKETYYCAALFLVMVFILWTLNPKIWQYEIGLMCPVFLYYIENMDEFVLKKRKRRR